MPNSVILVSVTRLQNLYEMAKSKKPSTKKVWVSDPKDLKKVEKSRTSVVVKDKKGNVKGGTEYYGQKV